MAMTPHTYSRLYARPKPALARCCVGLSDKGCSFIPLLCLYVLPYADWPGAFTAHPVLFGG